MKEARAIITALLLLVSGLWSRAQTVEVHSFTNLNRNIPDGNASGMSDVRTIASAVADISTVRIKLRIAGQFNGDLYGYVRQGNASGTNFCVLFNRPGRTAINPYGYADAGFDVTFGVAASNGDIHNYQSVTTAAAGSALAGIWKPDGRTNDPVNVLESDVPATSLNSFTGANAGGEWTLFLADLDSGATNMLLDWEVELTGTGGPILWVTPGDITYGTALDGNQLNASSPVAGSFSYWPVAGTMLHAGIGQTLSCGFTPLDTLTYNSVTSFVSIDVLKRALTIAAHDKSQLHGDPLPVFTGSYSGFVNGDDPSMLSTPVVFDCAATPASDAGIFPITPGNATSPDYNIAFVNGALTVAPDDEFGIVFLTAPATYLRRSPPVKLDASARLIHGGRAHFGGGRLTVTIISNAAAGDVIGVFHQGTDGGLIGLVGDTVFTGDLPFAQMMRAAGPADPIVFDLNTNATPAAVQGLVRDLSFVTTNSVMTARAVELTLTDGTGASSFPTRKTVVIDRAPTIPPYSGSMSNLAELPRGFFHGLILRTNDIRPERSGSLGLKVNPSLSYSGYFIVGGRRTAFSGRFNENGHAAKLTSRGAFGLELELVPETDRVRGALTSYRGGGWSSELLGYRAGYANTNRATQIEGTYTLSLPGSADPAVAPAGNGYATARLDALGHLRFSGRLADGQVWGRSVLVSSNGLWPVCTSLDRNQGIIIGWQKLDGSAAGDVTGTLTWIKPGSSFYPNGFAAELDVIGSRFTRITGGSPALSWAEGEIQIYGGNFVSPATNQIMLSPVAELLGSDGPIQQLKFAPNPRSGVFSGQFLHPVSHRATRYSGVFLQNRDMGAGYFLGLKQGGLIRLMPATESP